MQIESFLQLARRRRAARHFRPDPVEDGLLESLLEAARWAPSGYNLQPTHYVVARDAATRKRLHVACLRQQPVLEAPVVVVFAGDLDVVPNRLDQAMCLDLRAGAITNAYASRVRSLVTRDFERGPFGVGWLRALARSAVLRRFRPVPALPALDRRYWVVKQVMLGAMSFLLAAEAAGLAALPMEGFDESRVRRILGIPRSCVVPLVVPVGYSTGEEGERARIPLEESLHRERW
jgi:nitroreductase